MGKASTPKSLGLSEAYHRMAFRGRVELEFTDADGIPTGRVERLNVLTTEFVRTVVRSLSEASTDLPNYIALGSGQITGYDVANADASLEFTDNGFKYFSQSFVISGFTVEPAIDHILVAMKRLGSSAGTVKVEIQTNSGGSPSGTILGTSSAVNINNLSAVAQTWVSFNFTTPVNLPAGTYHFVIVPVGYNNVDGVTELYVGADQSSPGYGGSSAKSYSTITSLWTTYSPTSDLCFSIIGKANAARTTLYSETFRKLITSKSNPSDASVRYLTAFTAAEGVGRIGELGMFVASSGGNALAIVAADFEKTVNQGVNVYWIIEAEAG